MWRSLTLCERAFHNVREICYDTKNMSFAKLIQAFGLGGRPALSVLRIGEPSKRAKCTVILSVSAYRFLRR